MAWGLAHLACTSKLRARRRNPRPPRALQVQIECGLLRPMVQPRNKRKAQAPPPMAAINALQVAHLAKRQALHDIDFGSQDSEA